MLADGYLWQVDHQRAADDYRNQGSRPRYPWCADSVGGKVAGIVRSKSAAETIPLRLRPTARNRVPASAGESQGQSRPGYGLAEPTCVPPTRQIKEVCPKLPIRRAAMTRSQLGASATLAVAC